MDVLFVCFFLVIEQKLLPIVRSRRIAYILSLKFYSLNPFLSVACRQALTVKRKTGRTSRVWLVLSLQWSLHRWGSYPGGAFSFLFFSPLSHTFQLVPSFPPFLLYKKKLFFFSTTSSYKSLHICYLDLRYNHCLLAVAWKKNILECQYYLVKDKLETWVKRCLPSKGSYTVSVDIHCIPDSYARCRRSLGVRRVLSRALRDGRAGTRFSDCSTDFHAFYRHRSVDYSCFT